MLHNTLYTEEIDGPKYFNYISSQPKHIKFLCSQFLRLRWMSKTLWIWRISKIINKLLVKEWLYLKVTTQEKRQSERQENKLRWKALFFMTKIGKNGKNCPNYQIINPFSNNTLIPWNLQRSWRKYPEGHPLKTKNLCIHTEGAVLWPKGATL